MGIREKLNENPMIAGGITVVVIVVAVGWILWSGLDGCQGGGMGRGGTAKTWYTTEQDRKTFTKADEGKLFFADSAMKITPFMKDGKEAVGVALSTCDGGKNLVVTRMYKYSDAAKAILEKKLDLDESGKPKNLADVGDRESASGDMLTKMPGGQWTSRSEIMQEQQAAVAPCPKGQELEQYLPK